VEKIILCGISTPPPHREIHKTALGAEFSVDWVYFESTNEAITLLKNDGYQVLAVEQTTDSIPLDHLVPYILNNQQPVTSNQQPVSVDSTGTVHRAPPLALVFGHEIHGVSQEVIDLCDDSIEIPQYGTKHSLNVAVAVGIVLWEVVKMM
jgi:tRNA G18 (ribose-2'-O)-methylase SpoU